MTTELDDDISLDSPPQIPKKPVNSARNPSRKSRCPCPRSNPPSTPPSMPATAFRRRPRARFARLSISALDLLDRGIVRVADRQADGGWLVNQWLKKAVLLSFRLNPMRDHQGWPRPGCVVGQGAVEIRRLERGPSISRRRAFALWPSSIVRRSAYIAPGRRADARPLSMSAPMSKQRHHGRHLGVGRFLRPDRQERAGLVGRRRHWRRAGADAGGAHNHRGRLLHRRALGSGRGLHRA